MKFQIESGKLKQFCRGSAWEELQLFHVSLFIWDGILPSWVIDACENFSLKRKSISSESRFGSETALDTVRRKAVMGKIFTSTPRELRVCILLPQSYPGRKWQAPSSPRWLDHQFYPQREFCMHTQTERPAFESLFIWSAALFSQNINRFLKWKWLQTLSLLSSPFVQFHFKSITEKNRNNQTFIPVKPGLLRPKQVLGSKSGSGLQTRRTILVLFHHLASEE